MSACGRKRTLISAGFAVPERPVSGKADIHMTINTDDLRTLMQGKIQVSQTI